MFGHADVVSRLLELGADVNQRNRQWDTALHLAVDKDEVDIVRLLLQAGANPSLKNRLKQDVNEMTRSEAVMVQISRHSVHRPSNAFA